MRYTSKKLKSHTVHFVEMTEDAYRYDTVTNKELKNRYGTLEWVSRADGLDRRISFSNIENIRILCLDSEITEDFAKEIVEPFKRSKFPAYVNYWGNKKMHYVALGSYTSLKKSLGVLTKREPKPKQKEKLLESNAAFNKRLGKWLVNEEKIWKNVLILIEKANGSKN